MNTANTQTPAPAAARPAAPSTPAAVETAGRRPLTWSRRLVGFVILWIIGVQLFAYAYEALAANWLYLSILIVLVVGYLVNMWARYRAMKTIEPTLSFQLWLYGPPTVFFLLTFGLRIWQWWTTEVEDGGSSLALIGSLLQIFAHLGVPVLVLLWVYLRLWRFNAAAA